VSPTTIVTGNLSLATEVRKNTRIVVRQMLLTTFRMVFTYVLSNVLYSFAAYFRYYAERKDGTITIYWLAVNVISITHTVEIFNLYTFDKDYRLALNEYLKYYIYNRQKKYTENRTTAGTVLSSQRFS